MSTGGCLLGVAPCGLTGGCEDDEGWRAGTKRARLSSGRGRAMAIGACVCVRVQSEAVTMAIADRHGAGWDGSGMVMAVGW